MADKRCTVSLSTFTSRNPQIDCSNPRVGQTFCCNAGRVPPENECTNHKTVNPGDTCLHMADKRCTVSIARFVELNPQLDCKGTGLKVGEPFCCNSGRVPPPGAPPQADGTCITRSVVEGDDCGSLASKCGVAGDYITNFNTQPNFCATLRAGQVICCGRGNLPDLRPKKNADGSCFAHTVQTGESCSVIAASHQLSDAELLAFNANTWGWNGCTNLWDNTRICLSDGTPPLPAPVSVCFFHPYIFDPLFAKTVADVGLSSGFLVVECCVWSDGKSALVHLISLQLPSTVLLTLSLSSPAQHSRPLECRSRH